VHCPYGKHLVDKKRRLGEDVPHRLKYKLLTLWRSALGIHPAKF
jgi:hypothetical protein